MYPALINTKAIASHSQMRFPVRVVANRWRSAAVRFSSPVLSAISLLGTDRLESCRPDVKMRVYELPSSWAGTPDALRQTTLVQAESEFIACGRSQICRSLVEV